jgi:hypothetical protein
MSKHNKAAQVGGLACSRGRNPWSCLVKARSTETTILHNQKGGWVRINLVPGCRGLQVEEPVLSLELPSQEPGKSGWPPTPRPGRSMDRVRRIEASAIWVLSYYRRLFLCQYTSYWQVKKHSTYWSNISASLNSQRIDGYPLDQAAV